MTATNTLYILLYMATRKTEGITLKQYALAQGISVMTLRRHISKGKVAAKLVDGKYGPEWRITELTPEQTETTKTLSALEQALNIIQQLQRENRDLAGTLGTAQERIRTLEVKLLTEGRQPWWKRLFRRKRLNE